MAKIKDEPAHFVAADINGGGQEVPGHWRQFLECSDGEFVLGTGPTAAAACRDAARERAKRERYLKLPAAVKLEKLLDKKDWCDEDRDHAIRALATLVLRRGR